MFREFRHIEGMEVRGSARKHGIDDTGLDELDVSSHPARDAVHFRRILAARQHIAEAENELREAVKAARAAGDSWAVIGSALDTTRQAAQQRFGQD